MSGLRVAVRGFSLPLHNPLATAHGAIESRLGFLVEVEDENGTRGYGEATPLPSFGTEDLSMCRRGLEEGARRIASASNLSVISAWRDVPWAEVANSAAFDSGMNATKTPCAEFALSTALADLAARRAAIPLTTFLRERSGLCGDALPSIASHGLVGGGTPAEVAERAGGIARAGFDAFKMKLSVLPGSRDLGLDLERVAALREVVGEGARIRLDANEAWSQGEADQALGAFAGFDIDYVEQPIAASDLAGLRWLSTNAAIPVAADEALLGEGLQACLAQRAAEILIVKPAALGSLSTCRALVARAKEDGLRLVWSTLVDGAVGRTTAIALAAALGPDEEVHGLGTAGLLSADLVSEPETPTSGRICWRARAGLGFDPVVKKGLSVPVADQVLAPFEVCE